MKILMKYLLRQLIEKKFRSFLVFFSLVLTTALFFTSLAVTDTISNINLKMHRSEFGNADIRIFPKDEFGASSYVALSRAKSIKNEAEYIIGTLNATAVYEPNHDERIYASVIGTTIEDVKSHNPITLEDDNELSLLGPNEVIISQAVAQKYHLIVGSEVKLELNGRKRPFVVSGIAEKEGIFLSERGTAIFIMAKQTLSRIYGTTSDQSTNIYIKLKDEEVKDQLIKKLQSDYIQCEVTEALNSSDLSQSMTEIQVPLKLVTIMVVLMSIFIIFTSFKVISIERLPIIGTFRSVGATKKKAMLLMSIESVIFGIVGGALGSLAGTVVLYVIVNVLGSGEINSIKTIPSYPLIYHLYAFVFAVSLSYFSALIPIKSIFKASTKDIILNTVSRENKRSKWWLFIGTSLFALAVMIPRFIPDHTLIVLIIDNTCIVCILVSVIMLIPYIIQMTVPILDKVFAFCGEDAKVATKNIRDNKNILNIIGLLAIGLSTLMLISTIQTSFIDSIVNIYSKSVKYDLMLSHRQSEKMFVRKMMRMEGILDATGAVSERHVEIIDHNLSINWMVGIDEQHFFDHFDMNLSQEAQKNIEKLGQDRNIIIGTVLKNKLGVKLGDPLRIKLGDKEYTYKIIGFLDTLYMSGNIGLISERNMMRDGGYQYYTEIYVKTSKSPDLVQSELKKRYLKDLFLIYTRQELLIANKEGVEKVFSILKSYSQLTMVIGIIGIINNFLVSFIERKKGLAIYRSIGMSGKQLKKMLILEGVSSGVIGGTVGLIAAIPMIGIMPKVMGKIVGPMEMKYSFSLLTGYFLAAIGIMTLASIIPSMKASKISIIETIKME